MNRNFVTTYIYIYTHEEWRCNQVNRFPRWKCHYATETGSRIYNSETQIQF